MSEPTTQAGKALLADITPHVTNAIAEMVPPLTLRVVAIEQEARANADRELREIAERGVDARRYDLPDGGIGWRDEQAKADDAYLEALERKS